MLYIQKKAPTSRIKKCIAEIKGSDEWKKAQSVKEIRIQFDRLPKDLLREQILQDQHYLCAYCMKAIDNNSLYTKVEHYRPLSQSKDNALDYSNFLCVCAGGEKSDLPPGEKRHLCCDAAKGDKEISINPFEQTHINTISYSKDGRIHSSNPYFEKDLTDKLKLNGIFDSDNKFVCDTSTKLVKCRRDAYAISNRIIEHLDKKGRLSSKNLYNRINAMLSKPQRDEAVGATVYFLKKKADKLKKMGK